MGGSDFTSAISMIGHKTILKLAPDVLEFLATRHSKYAPLTPPYKCASLQEILHSLCASISSCLVYLDCTGCPNLDMGAAFDFFLALHVAHKHKHLGMEVSCVLYDDSCIAVGMILVTSTPLSRRGKAY